MAQRTSEDLLVVERSSALIVDLDAELCRLLPQERRSAERLRLLRERTNRITRAANDAVHAYRRASRVAQLELKRPDGDVEAATATLERLDQARRGVLDALELAQRHYPAADGVEQDSSVR